MRKEKKEITRESLRWRRQAFHTITSLLVTIAAFGNVSSGQNRLQSIVEATSLPSLAVEGGQYTKVKIFASKRNYRLEELLHLHVAILFNNQKDFYFPNDFDFRLAITDSKGRIVHTEVLAGLETKRNFVLVSEVLLTNSVTLILGCENSTVSHYERSIQRAGIPSPQSLFDNNAYGVPADACIDVNGPETLNLTVTVVNNFVVDQQDQPPVQTIVGEFRSPAIRVVVSR
jgi:hypothetical protein